MEGIQRDRLTEIAREAGIEIDVADLPEFRPGCASRTRDPEVAAGLAARAARRSGRIRARTVEIGGLEDPFESLFDRGVTDGLPVVPPTPERVVAMLEHTSRDPQEVVAVMPPYDGEATVEKVAINAVMAGCPGEALPVVLAAVEAAAEPQFALHGLLATTMPVGPTVVVSGPYAERIGMNSRGNALGQGNRANVTIGRALQLVVRNVGGGRPGEEDRGDARPDGQGRPVLPGAARGQPVGAAVGEPRTGARADRRDARGRGGPARAGRSARARAGGSVREPGARARERRPPEAAARVRRHGAWSVPSTGGYSARRVGRANRCSSGCSS